MNYYGINDVLEQLDNIFQLNEINLLLENISSDIDLLRIHEYLSPKALDNSYLFLNELNLANNVKEHLLWSYYLNRLKVNTISDNLFNQLIEDH